MNVNASPARTNTVEVKGDVYGSIIFGDNNCVVNQNYGTIINKAASPPVARHPAVPRPPRPPMLFLDRGSEVYRVEEALANNRHIALYGVEGTGKTTLLKEVANRISPQVYPDGVVHIDGEWDPAAAQSLRDLVQAAFNALFASDPLVKVDTAKTYLGSVQVLFLLDHLLLSPEAMEKLPDLFPAGGLLWASENPPPPLVAQTVLLEGLPRNEAVELFLKVIEITPAPIHREMVVQICGLLEDLPLAIITLASWARQKGLAVDAVLTKLQALSTAGEGSGLTLALVVISEALSDPEQALFSLAAGVSGPFVEQDVLVEASGLDSRVALQALDSLMAMGLIQEFSPELGMYPVIKQFAHQRLSSQPEAHQRMHAILLNRAGRHAGDLTALQRHKSGLLGTLDYAIQAADVRMAETAARLVFPLLVLDGKWDAWESVFQRLANLAESTNAQKLLGWALHEMGTNNLVMGNQGPARQLLTQAYKTRLAAGDPTGAAYSLHNLNRLPPLPPTRGGKSSCGRCLPIIAAISLGGLAVLGLGLVLTILAMKSLLQDVGSALGTTMAEIGPPLATRISQMSTETAVATGKHFTYTPEAILPSRVVLTDTLTPSPTQTNTPSPSSIQTSTSSPFPTHTNTPSPFPTHTNTPSPFPTHISTASLTPTIIPQVAIWLIQGCDTTYNVGEEVTIEFWSNTDGFIQLWEYPPGIDRYVTGDEINAEETKSWNFIIKDPPGPNRFEAWLVGSNAMAECAFNVAEIPTLTPTRTPRPTIANTPIPIEISLFADADVYIDEGCPTCNYSKQDLLRVGNNTISEFNTRYWSFVRFNLLYIPPGSRIVDATLEIYLKDWTNTKLIDVEFARVNGRWDESGLTWNKRPLLSDSMGTATVDATLGWKTWNLTGLVQDWVDSRYPNYGLMLFVRQSVSNQHQRVFFSRETSRFGPRLIIKYQP